MVAEMIRMRDAGSNSIWIGHNNPGEVDASKVEPGLSFAVWYALEHETGPRQVQAQAMADAVRRALEAAKTAGLRVVLPIGYQIMMGAMWNRLHPEALRRTYTAAILQIYGSEPTASPYDPTFRADVLHYYQWIEDEWVRPYHDTIEMLSLSDEPLGGDYSNVAQAEFVRRYGKSMNALGSNEQWKLGEFEAGVIVDFATWSAQQWQTLDPDILTTISFHSEDARQHPGLPEVERLFSETPANFAVTFDTYLHDDLPTKPATDAEIAQLKFFLTTLGHYSKVYHKPVVLWAGVNAWGLAQQSTNPLGTSDATTNIALLYDLPRRAGGEVLGIYAWTYNVKQQGLYNFDDGTTYDPGAMEAAVDSTFQFLRDRPAPEENLQVVVIAAPRELYDRIAQSHLAEAPPAWFDTATIAIALQNRTAALVTPGATLNASSGAEVFICVAQDPYLDAATLDFLAQRVNEGKIVMGPGEVASEIQVPREAWSGGWQHIPPHGGVLYSISQEDTAQ